MLRHLTRLLLSVLVSSWLMRSFIRHFSIVYFCRNSELQTKDLLFALSLVDYQVVKFIERGNNHD